MDVREKLVELLDDIQQCGEKYTDYEIYGMRLPDTVSNEEVANHLIANGVTFAKDINAPSKWISVKDRLPEDASTVLAIDSDGTISSAYYVGRWHSGGDLDEDAVTHWMPLPQPPKGE